MKKKPRQDMSNWGDPPHKIFYEVVAMKFAIPLIKLFFGIKTYSESRLEKIEGPMVCVGNHPSYLDPFIMAAVIKGRQVNFIAGAFLFRNPILRRILRLGGCIPKVQFQSDARAVKAMLTVLKRNGAIGLFPEGTRFVDGKSIAFDDAIVRMIKKTNSALVIVYNKGAYSTWPRWSKSKFRRGKIYAGVKSFLTSQQVEAMSLEELHQFMLDQLTYDENEWLKNEPHSFKSKKRAVGAENIATDCPKCNTVNSMSSYKNKLFCLTCDNRVLMLPTGFLVPEGEKSQAFETLAAWRLWQKQKMSIRIQDPTYSFEEVADLYVENEDKKFELVSHGGVEIKEQYIIYRKDGFNQDSKALIDALNMKKLDFSEEYRIFDATKLRGLGCDYGYRFEIVDYKGQVNRFVLQKGQRVSEFQLAILAIQESLTYNK